MTSSTLHVDHVGSALRPAEPTEIRFKLPGLHDASLRFGHVADIAVLEFREIGVGVRPEIMCYAHRSPLT
jgi:hypothetical protein